MVLRQGDGTVAGLLLVWGGGRQGCASVGVCIKGKRLSGVNLSELRYRSLCFLAGGRCSVKGESRLRRRMGGKAFFGPGGEKRMVLKGK